MTIKPASKMKCCFTKCEIETRWRAKKEAYVICCCQFLSLTQNSNQWRKNKNRGYTVKDPRREKQQQQQRTRSKSSSLESRPFLTVSNIYSAFFVNSGLILHFHFNVRLDLLFFLFTNDLKYENCSFKLKSIFTKFSLF